MTVDLLPSNFDELVSNSVQHFWSSREAPAGQSQDGGRAKVIAGKNMDGFIAIVQAVTLHCGLPATAVHTRKKSLVIPGYFRATKNWDVLIIHKDRLVAVLEFKSQVGSFGNNFNNRTEEVIGSATDFWVASSKGAYSTTNTGPLIVSEPPPILNPVYQNDPRPPFLGWLMLLEDSPEARTPVRCDEPHFTVFPEFREAGYAQRYRILCERLVQHNLYSAACLLLSPPGGGSTFGQSSSLSAATGIRNLFAEFGARIAAAAAMER